MKTKLFFIGLLAVVSMSFTTLLQNSNDWELLGSRQVDYTLDRDEILVTRLEGVFTAVKVKVKKGSLNMHSLVLHYGNGEKDEINLKQNFGAESESRVIDLPGNKRVIQKAVFTYDTKTKSDVKAVVELWGRH